MSFPYKSSLLAILFSLLLVDVSLWATSPSPSSEDLYDVDETEYEEFFEDQGSFGFTDDCEAPATHSHFIDEDWSDFEDEQGYWTNNYYDDYDDEGDWGPNDSSELYDDESEYFDESLAYSYASTNYTPTYNTQQFQRFPKVDVNASNVAFLGKYKTEENKALLSRSAILDDAYAAIDKGVFDISDLVPDMRDLTDLTPVMLGAEPIGVEDVVYISLRNNEDVESAYLNRETQIRSLCTTENTFRLTGNITKLGAIYNRTHSRSSPYSESVTLPAPSIALSQRLKTGGSLSYSWQNSYSYTRASAGDPKASSSSSVSLSYTQPLLKGGGFEIGKLSLTRAYITEEKNLLALRTTVINNITSVAKTYRAYLSAIKQFDIDKKALEKSRQQFQRDKSLVLSGRKPKNDLLNSARNAANKEFTFEGQIDSLDKSRIALLRLLNLDLDLNLRPLDIPDFDIDPKSLPTPDEALSIALLNNPTYLTQLLSYRESELSLMEAKNNTLWSLDFAAGIASSSSGDSSLGRSIQKAFDFRDRTLSAGLSLTIPVNDRSREDGLVSARIGLRNAKISLRKQEETLKQTITDSLRNIKQRIVQLRLKRIETALAEKQLEAKKIELDAGRITNFEYTDILDTLIAAQSSELTTRIGLLDALTDFDQTLGTTLDTWGVSLKDRTANRPLFKDTLFNQPEPSRVKRVAMNSDN